MVMVTDVLWHIPIATARVNLI